MPASASRPRPSAREARPTAADVPAVVRAFGFEPPSSVSRLGNGLINDTFAAVVGSGAARHDVVAQCINTSVFTRPDAVMANMARITAHLRSHYARDTGIRRRTLSILHTPDGAMTHVDGAGRVWRLVERVPGAHAPEAAADTDQAQAVARTFGEFFTDLADLPPPPLHETIPHFHDLPHRLAALDAARRTDGADRARRVVAELDRARELAAEIVPLVAPPDAGDLPARTMHNDGKVNNVLLDDVTGEPVCVLDLDTTMPGPVFADVGELVRTVATTAAEDERDTSGVDVDPARLDAVVRGWVLGAAPVLEPDEAALLPHAGPALTLENAVRFLTDHLHGDVYFRVDRPDHNLDRARAQLRLCAALLARTDVARAAVGAARHAAGRPPNLPGP